MDSLSCFISVFICEYKLSLTAAFNLHFCIFIYIAVCMTSNSNRISPCRDIRCNALYKNRSSENSTVQNRSNRTVRGLPHFCQVIFRHSCGIRSNCCTFNGNSVFFSCFGTVESNLILCFFPVLKTKVIVLCVQVDIRFEKNFFDPFPKDSCHFVAVHFDQRCFHLNFCHCFFLPDKL